MTKEVDGKTEQQEEVVNLFADGFDDKSLQTPVEETPAEPVTNPENAGPANVSATDDVPEKYRGKSLADVIHMHQEAEKAYGRGQNELGELRKLTDQILQQQLGETSDTKRKKLDTDSLLEDPDAALEASIAENPRIKELEAKLTARERAEGQAAFNRKHPNAGTLVNDPAFLKWASASPTRQRLLAQADQTFDYELASEIITMYEQTLGDQTVDKSEDKAALGNAKPSAGSASGGKKVYFKRAELMRLKAEDPERYEKLQPQIMAAYAEGRVR